MRDGIKEYLKNNGLKLCKYDERCLLYLYI